MGLSHPTLEPEQLALFIVMQSELRMKSLILPKPLKIYDVIHPYQNSHDIYLDFEDNELYVKRGKEGLWVGLDRIIDEAKTIDG